jgi:hypothetical protein
MAANFSNVFNILEEELPNLRSREDFWPMQGRSSEPFWKSSVELRMVGRVGADFRFASIWFYWRRRSPPPSPVSVQGHQLISAKCPGTALF